MSAIEMGGECSRRLPLFHRRLRNLPEPHPGVQRGARGSPCGHQEKRQNQIGFIHKSPKTYGERNDPIGIGGPGSEGGGGDGGFRGGAGGGD